LSEQEEYSEVIAELRQTLEVGSAAKSFFDTIVGRYLLRQASLEEEQAFKEWLDVDPEDAKAIRLIQERARVPKLVFAWLRDAVRELADADQRVAIELEEMGK